MCSLHTGTAHMSVKDFSGSRTETETEERGHHNTQRCLARSEDLWVWPWRRDTPGSLTNNTFLFIRAWQHSETEVGPPTGQNTSYCVWHQRTEECAHLYCIREVKQPLFNRSAQKSQLLWTGFSCSPAPTGQRSPIPGHQCKGCHP